MHTHTHICIWQQIEKRKYTPSGLFVSKCVLQRGKQKQIIYQATGDLYTMTHPMG